MRNVNLLLLVGASLAFTVGGIFMKYAEGLTKPAPSALVFLLFALGAALQTVAMRNAEMASSYIFVLGLESVLAFLFGVVLFREPATFERILAVALVSSGIVLLHR